MDSPESLGADRVWFRLIRLHGTMSAALSKRLRELNLSLPQCDVLTTLTEREGLSQQELAERLFVTKGNVSGLIDRLTKAGLVERCSIEGDRRTHAIFLTKQGRERALQGVATQRAFVAETLGRLTPAQLSQMDGLLALTRETLRTRKSKPPVVD